MTAKEEIIRIASIYSVSISDIDIDEYQPGRFSGTCTLNGEQNSWLPKWYSNDDVSSDFSNLLHNYFFNHRRTVLNESE